MSSHVVFFSMGILSAIIINKWIQSNSDAQPDTNVSDVTSVGIQTTSETHTKSIANADAVFEWFETVQPSTEQQAEKQLRLEESNNELAIERTTSPDHIQYLLNRIIQNDSD